MQTECIHSFLHASQKENGFPDSPCSRQWGQCRTITIQLSFGIAGQNATGIELEGVWMQCCFLYCFPLAISLAFIIIFSYLSGKTIQSIIFSENEKCIIKPGHILLKNQFWSFKTELLRKMQGVRREKIQRDRE